MERKSKKKIILIIIIVLAVLLIAILGVLLLVNNDGLKLSGSYYDNLSDFAVDTNKEQLTGLSKAYLEHVTYKITEIDKENLKATLVVKVPDMLALIPNLVEQVINANKDVEYDELSALAKTSIEESFKSKDLMTKESTIQLSIEKRDDSYKLIPNKEWDKLIFGNLEDMYREYLKTLIGEMTE